MRKTPIESFGQLKEVSPDVEKVSSCKGWVLVE